MEEVHKGGYGVHNQITQVPLFITAVSTSLSPCPTPHISIFLLFVEGNSMSHNFLFCDIISLLDICLTLEGHMTCLYKPSKYIFSNSL